MKVRQLAVLFALILLAGAVPAMANGVPIQLGSLVPLGSCVPTISSTCTGPSSVTVAVAGLGNVTITAFSTWPGTLGNIGVTIDQSSGNPVPYLGVAGNGNDDEIDVSPIDVLLPGEVLQISFSVPVFVSTIDLNKLFLAGISNDTNNEVAGINFLLGSSFLGANFYAGTQNGQLSVLNPFGNTQIDMLQFWAVPTSSATNDTNSDFGVSGISASLTPVPEPGMLLLFGSGLTLIAARIRRRKNL